MIQNLTLPARIETKTDAVRILRTQEDVARYIEEFGDVSVVYDAKFKVYRVPALADEIAKYTAAKAADCAKWGCE